MKKKAIYGIFNGLKSQYQPVIDEVYGAVSDVPYIKILMRQDNAAPKSADQDVHLPRGII